MKFARVFMIKKVAIVEDDRGLREQLAQILGAARDVRRRWRNSIIAAGTPVAGSSPWCGIALFWCVATAGAPGLRTGRRFRWRQGVLAAWHAKCYGCWVR